MCARTASRSTLSRALISLRSPQRCCAAELEGCHTMFVDSYLIDDYVPMIIVRELLTDDTLC
jgi:hypothetical protein